LEKNTVQKILKAENGRIGEDKESMTEKRNQRELLWFQTGGALNFITAAPHCGDIFLLLYKIIIVCVHVYIRFYVLINNILSFTQSKMYFRQSI
jgi:hypothetical protein